MHGRKEYDRHVAPLRAIGLVVPEWHELDPCQRSNWARLARKEQ